MRESLVWHQCCMSAVSRTDICLTSAAGQAAGQTSASSVMLRVHCLTGFDMGIRGCQGQQLQIDAGSSMSLVKGFGHKSCAYKASHERHKRSLVGLLLAGLLERSCASVHQRASCSQAVVGAALQLCPCCLDDQCLMGLPQSLYGKAQKHINAMCCIA